MGMKRKRDDDGDIQQSNAKPSGRPRKKSKKSINTGRKPVSIDDASIATQYRRAHEVLKAGRYNGKVIEMAASLAKKKSDELEGEKTSNEPEKYMRHTPESALAFYLEYDYSVSSYKALVSDTIARNCPIYPSYETIVAAMSDCLPQKVKNKGREEIEVVVTLQNMLNKFAERLCYSVASNWAANDLEMITTIGFDSSSGHTNSQQKCTNVTNENPNPQQSLFVSSMILISLRNCETGELLWTNPSPQSVRFCRPLRIALEKEDNDATIREHERLKTEISKLRRHKFKLANNKSVRIKFTVYQTLFDGKCLNAILGNKATTRCPVCKESSHNFGDFEREFLPKAESLKYGLGLLHCEIKVFEHLLHISYRQTIDSWDVKKDLKGKLFLKIFSLLDGEFFYPFTALLLNEKYQCLLKIFVKSIGFPK